jgi:hypothetical protein
MAYKATERSNSEVHVQVGRSICATSSNVFKKLVWEITYSESCTYNDTDMARTPHIAGAHNITGSALQRLTIHWYILYFN